MPDQPRLRCRLTLLDCGTANTFNPASAERRLARALKALLRSYGFRVVSVEDVTSATTPPDPGNEPS